MHAALTGRPGAGALTGGPGSLLSCTQLFCCKLCTHIGVHFCMHSHKVLQTFHLI